MRFADLKEALVVHSASGFSLDVIGDQRSFSRAFGETDADFRARILNAVEVVRTVDEEE